MSYNHHNSTLHLLNPNRGRVDVEVDAEGRQVLDVSHLGFTLRVLRGAAAHYIKRTSSDEPTFHLRYQGHMIGTINVVIAGHA